MQHLYMFIFIPGHIGVLGNEMVARLAGIAIVSEGQPVNSADIINSLRELSRDEDF